MSKRTVFASVLSILLTVLLSFSAFADSITSDEFRTFTTQDLISKLGTSAVISPSVSWRLNLDTDHYGTFTPNMGFYTVPWLRNYDNTVLSEYVTADWFNVFGSGNINLTYSAGAVAASTIYFPAFGYGGNRCYFYIAIRQDGTYFDTTAGNMYLSATGCSVFPDSGNVISADLQAVYDVPDSVTGDGIYTIYRYCVNNVQVIKGIVFSVTNRDSYNTSRTFNSLDIDIMCSDIVFENRVTHTYSGSIDTQPFSDNHAAESDIASLYDSSSVNSVLSDAGTALASSIVGFNFWGQVFGMILDIPHLYSCVSVACVLTLIAVFLHLGIPFIAGSSRFQYLGKSSRIIRKSHVPEDGTRDG